MMKLMLIRHADSLQEGSDPQLSDIGKIQAKLLAKKLMNIPIKYVYVSDLKRTVQTFEEYSKLAKGVSFEKTDKIREIYRVIVGCDPKPGTSENREQKDKERIENFIDNLVSKESEEIIALFTHGNVIKYIISKFLDSNPVNVGPHLSIIASSFSLINFDAGKADIKFINNIEHLTNENSSTSYFFKTKEDNYLP